MEHSTQKKLETLITAPNDVQKALAGEKTAQRRNTRHGDPGDTFMLQDVAFELTDVYEQTVGELTDEDARKEGYADVAAYRDAILAFHPGMPWIPQMKMWVHEFRKRG